MSDEERARKVARVEVGDRATWVRCPRGGWSLPEYIPVRVVAIKGDRASVMARLVTGGEKRVSVKLENLRRRATAAHLEKDRADG